MITVETWVPGSNEKLDNLFETHREKFYTSNTHVLCKNYTKEHFKKCSALSIAFENNLPIFCSSILNRSVWPKEVFRIGNRFWRTGNSHYLLQKLSPGVGEMMLSQLDWLNKNTNYELAFISRQYDNWQNFMIQQFKNRYQINFETDTYKYQTCETPNDDTCWQQIIYVGNSKILSSWNRK